MTFSLLVIHCSLATEVNKSDLATCDFDRDRSLIPLFVLECIRADLYAGRPLLEIPLVFIRRLYRFADSTLIVSHFVWISQMGLNDD